MRYHYHNSPTVLDRLDNCNGNRPFIITKPAANMHLSGEGPFLGPRVIMMSPSLHGSTVFGQLPGLAIAALMRAAAAEAYPYERLDSSPTRWDPTHGAVLDAVFDDGRPPPVGPNPDRPDYGRRDSRIRARDDVIEARYVEQEAPRRRPEPGDQAQSPPRLRKLLPETGERCVVSFGDFRDTIGPQLAHPERLRDNHRIPCVVQVFAAHDRRPLDARSHAEIGDVGTRLQVLTRADAKRLRLDPALAANPESAPGMPEVRYFDLKVTVDPSADPVPTNASQPDAQSTRPVKTRTTVPQKFIKPWTFVISRDEAAFDIDAASSRFSIRRLAAQMRSSLFTKRARQKWRSLLIGRDVDSQLWDVPPPKGAVRHPDVRQWLVRALRAGGYDVGTMLHEWEIYWRRRGCI